MSRGFLYYFTGGKHAAQMLVSIYSLRRFHDDPILVACGDDEAQEYMDIIAADKRLGEIRTKRIALEVAGTKQRGKGRQHCGKAAMGKWTDFDQTIFLDADTAVVGKLDELWPFPEEVVLTQFATWVTTGGKLRSRLAKYRHALPAEVAMMTAHSYPAINTGVLSWDSRATGFHAEWQRVCLQTTLNGEMIFMGDEITANLIFTKHPHRVLDHRWNFSPLFSVEAGIPDDIKVWHFHGGKHLRGWNGDHEPHAFNIWWPLYCECHRMNLANVHDWTPGRDKTLEAVLCEYSATILGLEQHATT